MNWSEYKKALAPAALAALAVVIQLATSGEWNRIETATAFTAFIAAGQVYLVPNIPTTTWAWRSLKAVVPAFVTLTGAIALWVQNNTWEGEAITVFLTGAGTALIALYLGNGGNTNDVGSKLDLRVVDAGADKPVVPPGLRSMTATEARVTEAFGRMREVIGRAIRTA